MRIWWVVILDILEGWCEPVIRSRFGHSNRLLRESAKAGCRPGICCKQVPGFFVLGIQPSRLGKRSMGRERKVGWDLVRDECRPRKSPAAISGEQGFLWGKAGLMCHAAHSCLCSRASGLGLLQSRLFNAWVMTILPKWPHRAIPQRSESALKIDCDVRW
jgi:hypothetical protein